MPTVRVWSRRILESEIARPLILVLAQRYGPAA